ncbi:MAG TPA: glycosyltransferase family 2 protein [Aliarcobacter thereius]|nr:glycosyltransferase family 2 protein [Aliarcobacter thereius]HJE03301.1 glycosyltransferase family 2 protein [Aliarcobacter thereius]
MQNELISIITPSYNSERYISDTLESVLAQTYQNWEMIIVDDVSPDNSNEIIEEYCKKDSRIKFIKLEQNSGAAVARNRAIEEAKGRYIAFLDTDDMWKPEKLEKQIDFMQKNNYAFTYTAYEKVDENGEVFGTMGVPSKVSYNDLLKTCVIGCLTVIYDAEKLDKVYMPLIRKRQDFGLWLKILKKVDFAYGINESLAFYTVRDDSISANKKSAAYFTWKLYRDIEKLNLLKAGYYFSHYAIRGILRTKFPKIARFIGFLD